MVSIFSDSWIDLVFEGRNQQYGAFELRKHSPRNAYAAGLISLSLLGMAIVLPLVISSLIGHPKPVFIPDVPPIVVDPPNMVHIVKPGVLPPPPPPPPHKSNTPPIIVRENEDDSVISDVKPKNDNSAKSNSTDNTLDSGQSKGPSNGPSGGPAPGSEALGDPPIDNKPRTWVEQMPEFPGGENALLGYVKDHVVYPDVAKENMVEGTVYVQFVVDAEGYVKDVKVVRSADRFLDKEALRVISSLPKWKPGRQNGKGVPVQMVLPIKFQTL